MDPFEELGMTAQNAEQHRRSATENQVQLRDSFRGLLLSCVTLSFPYSIFLELRNYREKTIHFSYTYFTVHESCVWTV